jgi:predicted metal-dependent phosphotriesterase family hydrolase
MKLMCIGAAGTEVSSCALTTNAISTYPTLFATTTRRSLGPAGWRSCGTLLLVDEQVGVDKQQIRRMCVDNPHELLGV